MPDMNTLPGTNILYGAEISYFTGKVRAYFRWKEIPFREETASREAYQNVILPRVGWPVIPVVVTPEDETLQDTTDIIDHFEARAPGPSIYPQGPAQHLAALLLECYGDEWLKIPAMHYRWNYNEEELLFEFGKLSAPDASEAEQREIGAKRAGPFRGALPALGVTPETRAAIETSYEGLLGELERHFAAHPYLFGDRPSIGDFGLIGPLYAHNYRDPKSGAMMRALAPKVARWVERMMNPPAPRRGDFLPGDEVPATLRPVLARMMREYLPVLQRTAEALNAWAADKAPGTEVPRALGMHAFELEGATGERAIFTFDLWMLQRPLDYLASLEGEDATRARGLLDAAGGGDLAAFPVFPRLARKDFKLVLA